MYPAFARNIFFYGLFWAGLDPVLVLGSMPLSNPPQAQLQDPLVPAIRVDQGQAAFLRKHNEHLTLARNGNIELLFIGDSITEGWKSKGYEIWNQYYRTYRAANFGIGGDSTQNVLWRIQQGVLEGIFPKVVVLMLGTNNSEMHCAEQIAAANAKIIREIQTRSPKTKVLLLGVFPRGIHPTKPQPEITQKQNATIKELNRLLAKMDGQPNIRFLDIGARFLKDGEIPLDLMPDQLHLSTAGYQIWAEAMDPLLKEMMKDKKSVDIYPQILAPGYEYTRSEMTLEVDGNPVPIRNYRPFDNELQSRDRNYYVAHFGILSDNIHIRIDAKEPLESWSISPKNYNVQGGVAGNILSFNLQQSKYLTIRLNKKNMLYVLVDPPETERPAYSGIDPHSNKSVFNVTLAPYHADRSGNTLSTKVLQNAIDAAGQCSDGGIVYIPEGIYMTQKLIFKSNVWLYLEPGAMIMADSNRAHWSNEWEPDHMLEFIKTDNTKIYGRGVIYCQGVALKTQKIEGFNALRLRPLKFQWNQNLVVDGITANESTEWTIAVEGGANIQLTNVKVLNEKKWGTNDGIDICGGSNIAVRHCFVSTMDDAYCVKGLFWGEVNNVHFEDIVADTTKDGFKIGMQGLTEVHHVTVKDLHVIRCYKGIDLIHYYGTANFRDCRFINCRIEKVEGKATPSNRGSTPLRMIIHHRIDKAYPNGVGSIYNIEVTGLQVDEPGPNPIILEGFDASNNVRDILINNSYLGGQKIEAQESKKYLRKFVRRVVVDGTECIPLSDEVSRDIEKISPPQDSSESNQP